MFTARRAAQLCLALILSGQVLCAQEKPAPEKPAEASAAPASAVPPIEKLGPQRYRMGAVEFDLAAKTVSLPVVLNITRGPLEYVLVHTEGKAHESLFTTDVRPQHLNIVLLLMDWKKSDTMFTPPRPEHSIDLIKEAKHIPESQMTLSLQWKDSAGAPQTTPVEQWIHNLDARARISSGPFIYTGSIIDPDGSFQAETNGSIIALFADPSAMVNNPRKGADLDDIWIPDPDLPEKGTPMTLVLKKTPPPAPAAPVAPPAEKAKTETPAKPAPSGKKKS